MNEDEKIELLEVLQKEYNAWFYEGNNKTAYEIEDWWVDRVSNLLDEFMLSLKPFIPVLKASN